MIHRAIPRGLALVAAAASLSVGAVACVAHVEPEPAYTTSATVETYDVPPADITPYPQTVYEGRPVVLYHDRWYYRDGGRWTYYRDEPPALRQRHYVQQAPPAYRAPTEHGREERRDERRDYAPPAERVR